MFIKIHNKNDNSLVRINYSSILFGRFSKKSCDCPSEQTALSLADDHAGCSKSQANVAHANERLPCFESKARMSTGDLSPTLGILRSLYKHVQVLVDFADNIVYKEGRKVMLIEESDTSQYKSFVRGVFVCFDKELQQVPSCNQVKFL